MIARCFCKSPYQDALYGAGMRVHNPMGAKHKGMWRCTVCKDTRGTPSAQTPDKKKDKK